MPTVATDATYVPDFLRTASIPDQEDSISSPAVIKLSEYTISRGVKVEAFHLASDEFILVTLVFEKQDNLPSH
jgi:hypothetical protein